MNLLERLKSVNLLTALVRFPLPALAAIVVSILLMRLLYDSHGNVSTIIRWAMSGYMIFISSLAFYSLYQSGMSNGIKKILTLVAPLLVGLVCFLLLPGDFESLHYSVHRLPYNYFGWVAIFHLIIAYGPYLKQGTNKDFWEYNKNLFIGFAESMFFALVLYLGLAVGILAIDQLFQLDVDSKFYGYLFIFLAGIFNTWYFLSRFPNPEYDDRIAPLTRPYLVFTQYIIIPIVGIYMVILYAYGAKIGFSMELPDGWVGQLTLWFSFVGIITYLLNYYVHEYSSSLITSIYKTWFFRILLVPLILLFIAIYRRVSDYGITEERYLVIVMAIWIAFLIALYIVKPHLSLRWIPISLSGILAFGLLAGPLGIHGASISSQSIRLKTQLINNERLVEGRFIPLQIGESSTEDLSLIRYLDRRTDMSFINEWIKTPIDFVDYSIADSTINRHHNAGLVYTALGFEDHYVPHSQDGIRYINLHRSQLGKLDITSFHELTYFATGFNNNEISPVVLNENHDAIVIQLNNSRSIPISSDELLELWDRSEDYQELDTEEFSYNYNVDSITFKIYFQFLNFTIKNNEIKIEGCDGILLE